MLRYHVVSGVFQRNFRQYFNSVIGYLFIVVFVTACALLTFKQFFADNLANLDQLSKYFPLLLLFIIPAISMGVWADERKMGTDALLFTLPASDLEILCGKFLSVVGVYTIALLFSLALLVPLSWLGIPDYGLILTTYIGYWLSGVTLLSIGMFASSLTKSSTIAFILGALFCAIPVLIGYYFHGNVWLESMGLTWHLHDFTIGLIALSGIIYFLSLTSLMLYLNLVVVSRRHWHRGQQVTLGGHFLVRVAAFVIAAIAINFIFIRSESVLPTRADFTAERLFTVDETTKTTLQTAAKEDRQITIQAFISSSVPREYVNLRNNLLNILRQYDRIGGANLLLRIVNVEPASLEAAEAKSLGLEARRVKSFSGGKTVEQDVYLGAVVTSSLGEVILPYIENGASLEYELTRAIATTTGESKRINVGVLDTDLHFSSLRLTNPQTGLLETHDLGYGQTYDQLRQHYAVKPVSLTELEGWARQLDDGQTEIDNPDVLIVASPSHLDNQSMLHLINYIEAGKPVLIMADPLPVTFLTKSADFLGIINAASQPRIQENSRWREIIMANGPKTNLGLTVRKTEHADCVIKFSVRFSAARDAVFSAVFRYSDDANYWRLELSDRGEFRLVRRENGQDHVVHSKSIPFFDTSIPTEVEVSMAKNEIHWRCGMLDDKLSDSFNMNATQHGIYFISPSINLEKYSLSIVEKVATEYEDAALKTIYEGLFPGSCALLCEKLGIEWLADEIAWQRYNPNLGFDPVVVDFMSETWPPNYGPKENMFLFASSYADHVAFGEDPISQGLKQVLFMYPGAIRPKKGSATQFQPLISLKSGDSGTAHWSELTTVIMADFVNRFTGERETRPMESMVTGNPIETLKPSPPVFPSANESLALAARIRGEKINVVFIADLDFLGDYYYKQVDRVNHLMDNMALLLNSIESLAGDSTFVRLRNRRPIPRTLTRFEKNTERFRQERVEQELAVEKQIKEQLEKTEKELDELQANIGADQELSMIQKAQSVEMGASSALMKMKNRKRKLEKERAEKIEEIRANERTAIANQESLTRALSVGFAPLLPLLLGLVVFFVRSGKERALITPERRARH